MTVLKLTWGELVHEVPMLAVKPSESSADSADVGANAEVQESEITSLEVWDHAEPYSPFTVTDTGMNGAGNVL